MNSDSSLVFGSSGFIGFKVVNLLNENKIPVLAPSRSPQKNLPKNTKEMSSVITKILNDDDLSRLLVNKGFNNRLNYSWSKTAKETLKCYNSLV